MTLCHQSDPELWFASAASKKARAKAICNLCPAQAACLATAMADKRLCGIWGGLDEKERDRLRRPRRVYNRRPAPPGPTPEPSPIRGVSFNTHKRRWVVTIRHGGAMHWVGTFATRAEAESAAIAKCARLGTTTVRSRSGKKAA